MKCGRHGFKDKAWDPVRPRGLVVRVLRRTSCITSRTICPEIIGTEHVGVGRTWPIQGNGRAPGGSVGSGEKIAESICVIFITPYVYVVMSSPVVSSRRIERSVGSEVEVFAPVKDQRMDLRATFGFLTGMRRRALPYLRRRRYRACRMMRRRVAFRSPLNKP